MIRAFLKNHYTVLPAGVIAIALMLCDIFLTGDRLARTQMVLITLFVFSLVAKEVRKSLLRPRQFCIALVLVILHVAGLMKLSDYFPLDNVIAAFLIAGVEAVVLFFLYGRIGQAIDPKGPYGLTDDEIRERRRNP
jgi:hypothetical protein